MLNIKNPDLNEPNYVILATNKAGDTLHGIFGTWSWENKAKLWGIDAIQNPRFFPTKFASKEEAIQAMRVQHMLGIQKHHSIRFFCATEDHLPELKQIADTFAVESAEAREFRNRLRVFTSDVTCTLPTKQRKNTPN